MIWLALPVVVAVFFAGRASKSTIVVFTKAPEITPALPMAFLPSARQRRAWRLP